MLSTTIEKIEGRRLRMARLGSGAPMVLLHGYPDNLQIFSELAPRLARRFEVVAFDWPGMGESEAWKGGATPAIMADRLVAILDHLGLAHAHVAGIDMGGQPALVFADRHAARALSVTVMNSLVFWDEKTSWEIDWLRRFGVNRFALRHLPRLVFRRAERTFFADGVCLPAPVRAHLWASFAEREVREFIVRMCAGYQATLPKLPAAYARITAPTLILWGERDRHFPPAHAERLHQAIRGSRLVVLSGAHHWMIWDRAPEIAEHIEAFVAR